MNALSQKKRKEPMGRSGFLKGQFFSYDAIVAGLMYVLLLTLLYVYWSSLRATVFTQIDNLFRTALDVSNVVLMTGNPVNWTTTNFTQIGITSQPNSLNLDTNKVANLKSLASQNYDGIRSMIGAAPYQFYITINSTPPVDIGIPSPANANGKVSIDRPVVYNGSASTLVITIWSNSSIS